MARFGPFTVIDSIPTRLDCLQVNRVESITCLVTDRTESVVHDEAAEVS
jgi:hypothetical protein